MTPNHIKCYFYIDKYTSLYGGGGKEYVYHHVEDESSFQLVDTSRLQRPVHQKRTKYNQVCVMEKARIFIALMMILVCCVCV